jgi:hypothetical protein
LIFRVLRGFNSPPFALSKIARLAR